MALTRTGSAAQRHLAAAPPRPHRLYRSCHLHDRRQRLSGDAARKLKPFPAANAMPRRTCFPFARDQPGLTSFQLAAPACTPTRHSQLAEERRLELAQQARRRAAAVPKGAVAGDGRPAQTAPQTAHLARYRTALLEE